MERRQVSLPIKVAFGTAWAMFMCAGLTFGAAGYYRLHGQWRIVAAMLIAVSVPFFIVELSILFNGPPPKEKRRPWFWPTLVTYVAGVQSAMTVGLIALGGTAGYGLAIAMALYTGGGIVQFFTEGSREYRDA